MIIYKIRTITSGNNDTPEVSEMKIIAGGWRELHETLSRICQDTVYIVREMQIEETHEKPFDFHQRIKA